ncbi:MAG: hypothetical protein ABJB12_22940 [Pseudomonadota bacterium]
MRSIPSDPFEDHDLIETLPASGRDLTDPVAPVSDAGWDSEAPTAVYSRRPVFAGPPPLPKV